MQHATERERRRQEAKQRIEAALRHTNDEGISVRESIPDKYREEIVVHIGLRCYVVKVEAV